VRFGDALLGEAAAAAANDAGCVRLELVAEDPAEEFQMGGFSD